MWNCLPRPSMPSIPEADCQLLSGRPWPLASWCLGHLARANRPTGSAGKGIWDLLLLLHRSASALFSIINQRGNDLERHLGKERSMTHGLSALHVKPEQGQKGTHSPWVPEPSPCPHPGATKGDMTFIQVSSGGRCGPCTGPSHSLAHAPWCESAG